MKPATTIDRVITAHVFGAHTARVVERRMASAR